MLIRRITLRRALTIPCLLIVAPLHAQTAELATNNAAEAAPVMLPDTSHAWSAAAQRDIIEAHALLRDNHPGLVDPATPGFAGQLDAARQTGLDLARRVTSAMGYDAAIAAFSNALQDGHAGANTILPQSVRPARQWPGFVPAWRGDQLLVHCSSEPDVPVGADIVSCDGTAIAALIRQNVFRFRGRASERGNWWVQARNVLVDIGNPFVVRPTACTLRHNGKISNVRLRWRAEEGRQFAEWRSNSYNGVTLPIGITTPASGITWIAMPDFEPDAKGVEAYGQINTMLAEQRDTIKNSRAVLLDLRNNQGGSSGWSRTIAKRLWGANAVNAQMGRYFANTAIVWRASAGNEAHLRAKAPDIRASGFANEAGKWVALADRMASARKMGMQTIDETLEGAGMALPPLVEGDLTIPVHVIVPGQCASACLDALDVFSRFANTKLIGAPSSGDSKYMEVRGETLSSGMTSVTIPVKMWVNRPRGHGEGYVPAITVTRLDWSTDDFLHVIETDLAAGQS